MNLTVSDNVERISSNVLIDRTLQDVRSTADCAVKRDMGNSWLRQNESCVEESANSAENSPRPVIMPGAK